MDFKYVDKKYRPIPFWSWNEKLDTKETKRQVGVMDDAGIGGFFMHARGGLLTEYMSDEWFDNVKAAIDEAHARGMHPWAYDENGWPSGFADGKVSGLGEEYQQKYLLCEKLTDENKDKPHTLLIKNGYRYYYEINRFYVDTLSKKVIAKFIEEVYAKYDEKLGNTFDGFFTDEPQIMRSGSYPWSFPFVDDFKAKYGYDLVPKLNELFFDEGDYEVTRVDYWKLVTELFSENFFKQIYDFCESHGYKFTGHLLLEESLMGAMRSSGASMPHYEYFSIPGMDWLGRVIGDCLTPKSLGSAAAQLGKKQVLSETFALAGHNVSHGELKRIYEWQMVRGINLLCTHLEGYSLRGIRKRDYPPAMYYQQPWWCEMDSFFEAMSRIGMLLAEGKEPADTLLILNQTTAWKLYRGAGEEDKKAISEYNAAILSDMKKLERKHILYHLGDEILMERHGKVEDGKLVIGEMEYSRVVLPKNLGFLPNTVKLLDEFVKAGGIITRADDIAPNPITEENPLTYTMRELDGCKLHYFVNTENATVNATFSRGNLVMDPVTGATKSFYGSHKFEPYESLVLIENGGERERDEAKTDSLPLSLLGEWDVKNSTYNSITLDKCDYLVDGELWGENTYVLDILPRLNETRRAHDVTLKYYFDCEAIPSVLYLCSETPEIFEISVNGEKIDAKVVGDFVDKSFKLIDIKDKVKIGKNEIVFFGKIVQTERTYKHLSDSWEFETMKNSLSYDMEIEQIYLVGDFGAYHTDEPRDFHSNLYKVSTLPVIGEKPSTVDIEKIDRSGFPMFAGVLTLEREIEADCEAKKVTLTGNGINAMRISVNGCEAAMRMFPPYEVDISSHLKPGKNRIELTLVNNLRNMQGPLHLDASDTAGIGPAVFFRESNVFANRFGKGESCHDPLPTYTDDYVLAKFGLRK